MTRKAAQNVKYGDDDSDSSFSDDDFAPEEKGEPKAAAAKKPTPAKSNKRKADDDASFSSEPDSDFDDLGDDDDDDDDGSSLFEDDEEEKPKAKAKKAPAAKKAKTSASASPAAKKKAAGGGAAGAAKKPKAAGAAKGKAAGGGAGAAAGGGAKKGAATKAVSEKDAGPLICEYIKQKNRPYSSQIVFDNLHGQVKKAHAVRVLDQLAKNGEITCKEFGKNKVYFPNQSEFADVSPEEFEQMDQRYNELNSEVSALREQLRDVNVQLAASKAQLTTQVAKERAGQVGEENGKLQTKIKDLQGGAPPISDEDMKKAEKLLADRKKRWKQGRRAVTDLVSQMCESEGQTKKPRELMEEMGIETDAEAGVEYKP